MFNVGYIRSFEVMLTNRPTLYDPEDVLQANQNAISASAFQNKLSSDFSTIG